MNLPTKEDYFTALYSSLPNYSKALGMAKIKNSLINLQWKNKGPILHFAIEKKDLGGIKYLIEHGANPNMKNYKGETSLHLAAISSDLQTIKYLIQNRAKINEKTENGETPIFYAAGYNNLNIVKYFVKLNSDLKVVNVLGENVLGYTPFSQDHHRSSDRTKIINYLKSIGLK